MASWYRKFLPNMATLSEPLYDLMKKGRKYEWTQKHQEAFEKVKTLVATAPILQRPVDKEKFVVQTDASDTGIGAVLYQVIDDEEKVLEFASRILTAAERNYNVTERECLAVIWAVNKFRPYIEGYDFKVVTDHSSLQWLRNLRNPAGRLARWALQLQGHVYTVEHRKGDLNKVPDALSRMFEENEDATGISTMTTATPTTDSWYLSMVEKITEDPTSAPTFKLVGGELYKYKPSEIVEETLGDDDAWN